MTMTFVRAAVVLAALALAGCNKSLDEIAPKAEHQLSPAIVKAMKAKGMSKSSPIMMRIFKEEGVLEVWKQKDNGRFDKIASYDICKWSGKLGPKFTEGDRQAPEGFYTVHPYQMNPQSDYYLAFNIGFPNAYDRAHGRTGSHLMVHGACSSAGCYSMTDEQIADIYAFARDAFRGGQKSFQVQAFPFRMTAENMARYRNDPNYDFWKMLKEGYDYFEITKVPPKVDVCEGRYVFNRIAEPGYEFDPTGPCPPTTQPESLQMAYRTYQNHFEAAFSAALNSGSSEDPKPSIRGMKEAILVADWSRRRARGERVSPTPPSLETVAVASAEPEEAGRQATAVVAAPAKAELQSAATDRSDASTAREKDTAAIDSAAAPAQLPSPRPGQKTQTASSSQKTTVGRILSLFGG